LAAESTLVASSAGGPLLLSAESERGHQDGLPSPSSHLARAFAQIHVGLRGRSTVPSGPSLKSLRGEEQTTAAPHQARGRSHPKYTSTHDLVAVEGEDLGIAEPTPVNARALVGDHDLVVEFDEPLEVEGTDRLGVRPAALEVPLTIDPGSAGL